MKEDQNLAMFWLKAKGQLTVDQVITINMVIYV